MVMLGTVSSASHFRLGACINIAQIFPTSMPVRGHIDGARMALLVSQTLTACRMLPLLSGTKRTTTSRNASTVLAIPRATMARASKRLTSTSTTHQLIRT